MESAREFKQETNPWTLNSVVGYQLPSIVRSTEAVIQPQSIALVSATGYLYANALRQHKAFVLEESIIKLYVVKCTISQDNCAKMPVHSTLPNEQEERCHALPTSPEVSNSSALPCPAFRL